MNGSLPQRVTSKPIKVRRYAHFDDPLTADALAGFNVTANDVASHSFMPLLGYQKLVRKMDFSVFPPLPKEKTRDIRYASHTDAAIYALYSRQLSAAYETYIAEHGLGSAVLAYRGGVGYNVPFAKSLFDEVSERKDCHVICLDISGFFDNIQHVILKQNLIRVLGGNRLQNDWFKIFERLTAYEYVLREDVEKKIGRVKKKRICQIDTFRSVVRPLIRRNDLGYGIPQGTPLSGLLANIYMLDFDAMMCAEFEKVGGSYRRYSDDIAIVLPQANLSAAAMNRANQSLSAHGMKLNSGKTCETTFHQSVSGQSYVGDLLQYLGFTFDGTKTLIRPESIKNFYAIMKQNLRRYIRSAAKRGIPANELRMRVLIGRFTHWGDSRNFVQYAYRASRELASPGIKRQLRNHVIIFDRHRAKMMAQFY